MIDSGLVHPWPRPVLEALARFQQGDIIAGPIGAFAADLRYPLWTSEPELTDGDDLEGVEQEASPGPLELIAFDPPAPYGIITTQTCDLFEQRPRKREPFLQVAPVYRLSASGDQRTAILQRQNIVEVLPPEADDGIWIADLRIEIPLEKSALAHREPIAAFADEESRIAFAERLGFRRARPALANELNDTIVASIKRKQARTRGRSRAVFEDVHKVSLAIEEGGRRRPVRVRVIVVTRGPTSEPVKKWFAEWEDAARQEAASAGITLHATGYRDATRFDLARDAHLVDLIAT